MTQWFERNRFEYHPEYAGTPYAVLLGLLGRDVTQGRTGDSPFAPVAGPPVGTCRYFAETQHSLCGTFLAYWEQHGGLALYGYPISEEFQEVSPTDGKTYTVQYFERNRFEYHPENAGTPYAVLLGLLGVQAGGFPAASVPQANVASPLVVADQFKGNAKWQAPRTMTGPAGMQISLFAVPAGPRMLAVAPNGDLFASLTRANQVVVLPDRNGDGIADDVKVFADGLSKPHGLAFHGAYLYVATEAAVLRYAYTPGQLAASGPPQQVAELPSGTSQGLVKDVNHDTRSITFDSAGQMYVSAGSDCDACIEGDPRRAAIMRFDANGGNGVVFAQGLRNAVGLDVNPRTGFLWASVNERNGQGNDFPPDLLTPILAGGNYGWPACSGIPLQPDPAFGWSAAYCAGLQSAAAGLPAHIAPLGIRFSPDSTGLPAGYRNGIFIALHGSSVHTPPYGADIRFLSLRPGEMAQGAQPVIQGWLVDGQYWGRPVDVAFGANGGMYVSDDTAGAVYRVTFQP